MRRLVLCALLASGALVLSYVESLFPLPLPLPGARLGLGNAMVLLALPALLMIFDPLTARLTLKAGFLKKTEKEVDVK